MIQLPDNRGQGRMARSAVLLVVVLLLGGIIAAVGLPVAIDAIEGDSSTQLTIGTSNTSDVNAELNATVDSVDTTADSATITLATDAKSTQKTIDNGTNATYSFDRGDVTVTVDDVSTGEATATYEYNKDFAYSDAASAIWSILGLALVLAAFLYFITLGLRQTDRL